MSYLTDLAIGVAILATIVGIYLTVAWMRERRNRDKPK